MWKRTIDISTDQTNLLGSGDLTLERGILLNVECAQTPLKCQSSRTERVRFTGEWVNVRIFKIVSVWVTRSMLSSCSDLSWCCFYAAVGRSIPKCCCSCGEHAKKHRFSVSSPHVFVLWVYDAAWPTMFFFSPFTFDLSLNWCDRLRPGLADLDIEWIKWIKCFYVSMINCRNQTGFITCEQSWRRTIAVTLYF